MVTITDDMRAVVAAAHLCFAATVSPDGRPNLSPKGTIPLRTATRRVFEEEGVSYPVAAAVTLQIEDARPLVSPGYIHIQDEESMRRAWAVRRAALDREFDAHVSAAPPFDPRRDTV